MNYNLVPLEKCTYIFNGKTPSRIEQREQGKPILKIKDVDENGNFINNISSFVEDIYYTKYKNKQVQEGDTLLLNAAHNSEYVGSKTFLVNNIVAGIIATGEWMIIRPKKETIDYKFLNSFVKSSFGKYKIKKIVKGIHLYPSDVKKIKIPLPPLEAQIRIASLLSRIEELIAKRKESIRLLDEFVKSTFLEMFGDPVRNEKGWELKKLPQLIAKSKNSLKRGPFGGALKKEIFVDEGYLIYEQNHALNNDYSFKRYFIDQKTFDRLKDFEVKAGDILISCSGVYLGKLSIVPEGALPGIINQALLKVTLNQNEMNKVFFVFVFSNPDFKNKYIISNRGSGIPNLPPMRVIKNIDFISPPIELQDKFANIVKKIEAMKIKYQDSLSELEKLYGAVSQRAFRGEL